MQLFSLVLVYIHYFNLAAVVATHSNVHNGLGGHDTASPKADLDLFIRDYLKVDNQFVAPGVQDQLQSRAVLYDDEPRPRDLKDRESTGQAHKPNRE